MTDELRPPSKALLGRQEEARRLSVEVQRLTELTQAATLRWILARTPDEKARMQAEAKEAKKTEDEWRARWGAASAAIMLQVLDDNPQLSEEDRRWFREEAASHTAQSSVAPDSPSSVAPPGGGAPSSGPRVNAGIGQEPSKDDPEKDGP